MSDGNREDGYNHWTNGGDEARDWFERQWRAWPKRVDERYTTNISFLYGGVLAYAAEHGEKPAMSDSFKSNVSYYEKNPQ